MSIDWPSWRRGSLGGEAHRRDERRNPDRNLRRKVARPDLALLATEEGDEKESDR